MSLKDLEKTKELREQEILSQFFPFSIPPKDVVDSTYVVANQDLGFDTGIHQTTSSILIYPRTDGRILVPPVALNNHGGTFNLFALVRETMPITCSRARRWSVWIGKNILTSEFSKSPDFTPEKGREFLQRVSQIKQIYQTGLTGKEIDANQLRALLNSVDIVGGYWLQYYGKILPTKISSQPNVAEEEVENLFTGFDQSLQSLGEVYENLDGEGRLLLDNSFSLVIKVRPAKPKLYVDDSIPELLRREPNKIGDESWRSPLEIVGDPRGVFERDVEAVYFPDDMISTRVSGVATGRLNILGVSSDRIHPTSTLINGEVGTYGHCSRRYERFTGEDLRTLITTGKLVHIFNFR
jgi:hypothetical protein